MPPLNTLIEYVISQYIRKSGSLKDFYGNFFKKDKKESYQQEGVTLTEMKNLYQKFCFISNVEEEDVKSKKSLRYLKRYGFCIDTDQRMKWVLKNVTFKDSEKVVSPASDSLSEFFNDCVILDNNNTEEDYVDLETFKEKYDQFCDQHVLNQKHVDPSKLKPLFNADVGKVPVEIVTRDKN